MVHSVGYNLNDMKEDQGENKARLQALEQVEQSP